MTEKPHSSVGGDADDENQDENSSQWRDRAEVVRQDFIRFNRLIFKAQREGLISSAAIEAIAAHTARISMHTDTFKLGAPPEEQPSAALDCAVNRQIIAVDIRVLLNFHPEFTDQMATEFTSYLPAGRSR